MIFLTKQQVVQVPDVSFVGWTLLLQTKQIRKLSNDSTPATSESLIWSYVFHCCLDSSCKLLYVLIQVGKDHDVQKKIIVLVRIMTSKRKLPVLLHDKVASLAPIIQ